jgi:hypothetical protein
MTGKFRISALETHSWRSPRYRLAMEMRHLLQMRFLVHVVFVNPRRCDARPLS